MTHPYRTHRCGDLTLDDAGHRVRLSGWVDRVRDLGGLVFATLRDATGVVQLIGREPQVVAAFRPLRPGWAVSVEGTVAARPARDVHPGQPTGAVEVHAAALRVRTRPAAPPARTGPPLEAVRAEAAARRLLDAWGLTDVGDRTPGPLARHLPVLDRVYRVRTARVAERTAPGGERPARLLEFELAFATPGDLRDLADALLRSTGRVPRVVPGTATGGAPPWDGEGTALVAGLPPGGHPGFLGRDLPLTRLAEPPAPDGPGLAPCLLAVAGGRIAGAGSVRRTEPPEPEPADAPADPLLREEIDAAWRAARPETPGAAWFVLDLDRLTGPGPACSAGPEPDAAARDLVSLLRAADPGRPPDDPPLEELSRLVERWDVEASAAMIRSRSAAPGPARSTAGGAALADLRRVLDDFSMDQEVCDRLLEVLPAAADRFRRLPPGDRFDWVWSVLGAETVRAALRDPRSYELIGRAVALRVVTDARQLTHLDTASLADLATVLDGPAAARVVPLLRQVLATTPAAGTALLAALAGSAATTGAVGRLLARDGTAPLLAVAEDGLCAPGLLPAALRAARDGAAPGALRDAVRSLGPHVLPNVPYDVPGLADALAGTLRRRAPGAARVLAGADPDEVALGVVHHLYRPVGLSFPRARRLLARTKDCRGQVEGAGLRPGGRHWCAARGRYEFASPGPAVGGLHAHLCKNEPSLLAKASVGICTAGDLDLFHRPDHHHLNLTDAASGTVVGNVQLHVLANAGRRVLLVRAVNATTGWLTAARARPLLEAALTACVELAAHSGADEVHLGEGLSFWHLNSSRPLLRALLEPLYDRLPAVPLDRPFFLFRFGRVDLELTRTRLLWARDARDGVPPPFRRILEVVA